jgi:hypothetical protein
VELARFSVANGLQVGWPLTIMVTGPIGMHELPSMETPNWKADQDDVGQILASFFFLK